MSNGVRGRPFAKGYDPRRYILNQRARRKGYFVAMYVAKMPSKTRAWLWKKIRGHYQRKAV